MNALEELEEIMSSLGPVVIKAAVIYYNPHRSTYPKEVVLKIGHSLEDLDNFRLELNKIEYDDGFGVEALNGSVVWFEDGRWLERHEYDGSEWWTCPKIPEIPDKLRSI